MARKRLLECSFLIPIRRDKNLSDGGPHRSRDWDWLEDRLAAFGGATRDTALQEGWYLDPGTEERVTDRSRRYVVAVKRASLGTLRGLLRQACKVFRQKCIYLSVAGTWSLSRDQAMKPTDVYLDLDGNPLSLAGLDAEERRLVARLRRRTQTNPDWDAFDNYWTVAVPAFYQARGLARKAVPRTLPWRIAQDLSGRLGIAAGLVRSPDYRDELEDLIEEKFPSRRAFCEATGISEDMLSHVLAGRKDLSLEKLTEALGRIGYRLRIVTAPAQQQTAARKRTG